MVDSKQLRFKVVPLDAELLPALTALDEASSLPEFMYLDDEERKLLPLMPGGFAVLARLRNDNSDELIGAGYVISSSDALPLLADMDTLYEKSVRSNVGYLYSIIVQREHEMKGYGTELLRQIMEAAKRRGYTSLLQHAGISNGWNAHCRGIVDVVSYRQVPGYWGDDIPLESRGAEFQDIQL